MWCNLYSVFQVHYDLGCIFFQQGCTDQPAFEKAREHFRQTKELFKKVDLLVYFIFIMGRTSPCPYLSSFHLLNEL